MRTCPFVTVDVFTDRRFGGNPLAVFPDATELSDSEMQALAAEFNLSETTFVLPPTDWAHTARVRIFNRTAEMPFAGHPMVGTACVLARQGRGKDDVLLLEVIAGLVRVSIKRDGAGAVRGAMIAAPQPLSLGPTLPPALVAPCAGLLAADILTTTHEPVQASVGNPFVIAEVSPSALGRAAPDLTAFREALSQNPALNGRYALYIYAREPQGTTIRARMFAPLSGTWEDPATGSAATPLAALLLSFTAQQSARYEVRQGVEMGRPSVLHATAERTADGICATVAGNCVEVLRGEALL
jgi:trans-2,3-dihydro-3-hydroxyanthranilate isomerase